ncbi:hypothetical protein EK21DRAFT_95700, partial [Setomelanomma holmii]
MVPNPPTKGSLTQWLSDNRLTLANLVLTTSAIALRVVPLMLYVARKTIQLRNISLNKSKFTKDIENIVDSSRLAEKITDALLDVVGIPQEIFIHVRTYCVVGHSSAEPIQCVYAGYRVHANTVFGIAIAFMVISLCALTDPWWSAWKARLSGRWSGTLSAWLSRRSSARSSAWWWLWISFYIVFTILLLLLGIVVAIYSLLSEQFLPGCLTIEPNLVFFGLMGLACIFLLM